MNAEVAAIVVTHNRLEMLERCVSFLLEQTLRINQVVIIDNASKDGTESAFITHKNPRILYIRLPQNNGGAGGFAQGLDIAIESGSDWVWMMDDDAEPHPTALEELMKVASDPNNVYGSLATCGADTSWTTTLLGPPVRSVDTVAEMPDHARVRSLPFLGFMIHRDLVQKIGLPDAGYFIAADDAEYCLRATRSGADIIIAGKSHIEHPRTQRYVARVLGNDVVCLRLAPWKRYYDTRNRLLIARKYYGFRLVTQTIPGSFVRLFAALLYEPRKPAQLWAFCAGMTDGLLGLKGRRHEKWRIPQ